METKCVDAPGRLYWDLRPHHKYPTIEFRAADVTPRLEDAVATAALARAVVAGVASGALGEPSLPGSVAQALLGENSWRAARDGTDAELVDVFADAPRTVPAREAVMRTAERLAPIARELGDEESLAALEGVFERGCAAARMRRAFDGELERDLRRLALWVADETVLGLGMDRRTEQRLEESTV
jgi:carboxylate-amine ligase